MPGPTALKSRSNLSLLFENDVASTKGQITADGEFEKDEAERRLEKLLFGDEAGFLEALQQRTYGQSLARVHDNDSQHENAEDGLDQVADEDLFFLDSGTGNVPPTYFDSAQGNGARTGDEIRPIWFDSDDDRLTVSLSTNPLLRKLRENVEDDIVTGREYIRRLRLKYERLHPRPRWAIQNAAKRKQLSEDSDEEMDSDTDETHTVQPLGELLRSGGPLTRIAPKRTGRKLRPEAIDIQRTHDIAKSGPSSVDALEFHPELPLLLSSGPSSTISLYHVSPQPPNPNPILTSLHLKGTLVRSASFGSDGQIFIGARRRYFHNWSLSSGTVTKVSRPVYGTARREQKTMENFKLSPDGNSIGLIGSSKKGGGCINVLSTNSMQWLCQCRIESRGGIADFAWWRNSQGFAVAGKNGEVSEFDMTTQNVIAKWQDDGSVGTTVISIGGDGGLGGSWVAIGSSSGVVNLYDRKPWPGNIPKRPQPSRILDQLTTPVSHLVFSHDGQMLVMASRWKKNALRLVHLPSYTVYRNWPTDKTPLGRVSSVALSRPGHLMAAANEQGKIRLWEIRD